MAVDSACSFPSNISEDTVDPRSPDARAIRPCSGGRITTGELGRKWARARSAVRLCTCSSLAGAPGDALLDERQRSQLSNARIYNWIHPLGGLVTSLIASGL